MVLEVAPARVRPGNVFAAGASNRCGLVGLAIGARAVHRRGVGVAVVVPLPVLSDAAVVEALKEATC